MIKKILPFERLIYTSTLQSEELIQHLKNEINGNAYTGKIYQNKFEIKRNINYRNSFLPVIKGEVTGGINGAKVIVKMDLIIFVKIFMCIWLGGVSIAFFAALYTLIYNNESGEIPVGVIFIPLFMLVVGITLVVACFKYESRKSILDLEKILNAKIISRQ